MVKKQHLAGLLCLGAAVSMTSCHDDLQRNSDGGQGGIMPNVELNTSVESSQKSSSRAVGDITVDDLSLTIKSADGSYSNTWNSVADYDPETKFKVGSYTAEAAYGDPTKEGFDCPAYFGAQDIEVLENQQTPVSLTATLANSMVSITYTDNFKEYMSSWDANLHSTGGTYIYYSQNEERPAYVQPGSVKMNVSFTTPAGDYASLEVASFQAVERHHYHITVDLNNGGGSGDAVLIISFDDSLDQEPVYIELGDELYNAPAPVISGAGDLVDGRVYTYVIGDEWATPIKANIVARGGIAGVTVTTGSQSLKQQGWPAEVDLMEADEVMQARLKQLGFDAVGLWKDAGNMAVLDFTDLVNHLTEVDDNANHFTILVRDRLSKVSEPFSFAVNATPMQLSLANPATLAVGATRVSFDMNFNGSNPKDAVKFQYNNERGTWTPMTVVSIEETDAEGVYRVTLEAPADSRPLTVKAVTKVKDSEPLTISRVSPTFALTVDGADVWATKATVALTSDDVDAATLASYAALYLSTDGATYTQAQPAVDGARLLVTGLTPGTKYFAKATVTGDINDACSPVEFTTETALDVPNGDFEALEQTLHESSMNQNGKWGITAGIYYQSTLTYTISEPTGWSSVNKKTTSGSTRNSWFVVPSTFNSTLSWVSTVPKIKVVGTGGGSATPESYTGFTAHSGNNAMVVRNVAWDAAGEVPSQEHHTTSGASGENHFNQKVANVSTISAGKLFIGSYDYANGQETYNEGTLFASRPATLKGYYTYACDSQDTSESGVVTVQLLNGSTVIGSGEALLGAADAFKEFSVNINYVANAPKATSLRIMFKSSDKSDESAIKVSTFNYRYESAKHGATLVVDNLSFGY